MFLGINTKPRLTNTQGRPQWPPKGGNDVGMHIIIVWHFSKRIYKTVPLSNGCKWDMFSAVFSLYTPKCGDVRILLGMMLHMLLTCNAMSDFEVTESNLDDKFWQNNRHCWSQLETNKILPRSVGTYGIYTYCIYDALRLWMWGLILGCCSCKDHKAPKFLRDPPASWPMS